MVRRRRGRNIFNKLTNIFPAAFKVIKGWLPPAAVKKIKFLTKSNMSEYVTEDQMLEDWGGSDGWQYSWLPENSEGKQNTRPQSDSPRPLISWSWSPV